MHSAQRSGRLALLMSMAPLLAGCYVLGQGTHLLRDQLRAEPIDRILADGATAGETRRLLTLVDDVRRFGAEDLGLSENRNYTTYVATDRGYLVDVVSASEAVSFTQKTWWFPFFGRFPYKGFYRREGAERLAVRLRGRGMDVVIRPVDGFSTLGFFRDPVYSFMTDYAAFDVADLVIHEQTHATVFLKNQVRFNEEMASFVGTEGALRYLRARYGEGSPELEKAAGRLTDHERFLVVVKRLYGDLATLYARALPREETLSRKAEIIADHQARFAEDYDRTFETDTFRSFAKARINNATLNLYMTYTQDLAVFYRLLETLNGDLPMTIARLRSLAGGKGDPRARLLEAAGD